MFFRLYRYGIRQTVRQKLIMFWSLLFPIILGTLFRAAFGEYIEEEVVFHQISVAYVEEQENSAFSETLKSLETDSELVKVIQTDDKKARKLLEEDRIEGIFYSKALEQSESVEDTVALTDRKSVV